MAIQFGCCTQVEYYDNLVRAGYDYIELGGKVVSAMSEQEFAETLRIVQAGPLPCRGLVSYCPPEIVIAGPGWSLPAAREYAQKCAARAGQLGIQRVGIGCPLSRTLPDNYDRQLAFRQMADFLAVTCQEFARYGIDVCVESLGYGNCNFINTLEESAELQKTVDMPNIKLALDFYNLEQSNQPDVDIAPYMSHVAVVHMSDDEGLWRRNFFIPGKSAVHQERVRRLIALGYTGDISIEIDVPVDTNAAQKSLFMLKYCENRKNQEKINQY